MNTDNMDAKLLIALLIAINLYTSCGAALRRTPKVYNALITTDENLTSSRAYPVIQPTLHENGIAHYPFGPFGPYNPYFSPLVRFGQPIAPGLLPKDQLPYPLPQFPPKVMRQPLDLQPQPYPGYPYPPQAIPNLGPIPQPQSQPQPQPTAPGDEKVPEEKQPTQNEQPQLVEAVTTKPAIPTNQPGESPKEKLPIPLNQFGLPPSLISLPQYPNRNGVPMLPPYGYNQFPLIYDPLAGFREQYLPPYNYIPNPGYPAPIPPSASAQPPPPIPTPQPQPHDHTHQHPQPTTDITDEETPKTEEPSIDAVTPSFESIKNGSKNNDVPDVPPPPIPSGAKSTQQ